MAIKFSNLASTTLASGVSSTATSVSVTSASSFPTLGSGDYFYATIGAGSGSEIVKVTGISGTTFTVSRGEDGTTAVSHSAGVDVALRVTAGTLEDLRDGGQVYTAGSGITLSGNAFSLTDKANYDAAYGWGDHAQAGYLTSYTDTNTTYTAGSGITLTGTTFSLTDKANYDAAYGWGDHSTAGYLTSHQSLSGYATETYVGTQISNLVDSSPAALNTLNELAAALGDDPNFATTVTNSIALKAPLASPSFTGTATMDGLTVDVSSGGATVTAASFKNNGGGANTKARLDFFAASTRYAGISGGYGASSPEMSFDISGTDVLDITSTGIDVNGDVNTSGLLKVGTNDTEYANNYLRFKPTGAAYIDHSTVGQAINFRLSNASSLDKTVMTMSSAGNVNINTGSLQFGGTTVIDASRNITAGNLTTSGYISQATGQSHYFRGGTDANWRIGSDITADTGGLVNSAAIQMIVGGGSSPNYGFQIFGHTTPTVPVFEVLPQANAASSITNIRGKLYINNTEVIDNSRNLTNIGTLNGGTAWTSANDGSGSGLDADLLDGLHASSLVRSDAADTMSGTYTFSGGHGAINITNSSLLSSASSTWTGDPGGAGKIQYHSNRWYIVADSSSNRIVQFRRNNSDKSYIDNNGALIGGGNWYSGNDGSGSGLDADLLDGQQGSYYAPATGGSYLPLAGGTLTGNLNTSGSGNYVLIGGSAGGNAYNTVPATTGLMFGGANDPNNYSIGTSTQNIGGNYTKLNIKWHTGIRFFSMPQYGGTRFYSDAAMSTETFSINNLDGHVRAANNLYANGGNLVWNASNDGSGSGLDADLLDGQQGSYYYAASNPSGYITSSGTANQSHMVSGNAFATTGSPGSILEYQQASGQTDTRLAPTGDWYNSIRMGHGNPYSYYSNTMAMKMTGTGNGTLYTQVIANNSAGGWNKYWHTNNDGSGSGLDADLLDGVDSTSFIRSDTADTFTGTLTMGTQQALVANNYGRGVFGLYSSTRYQHVWSMGTAYKTSDDGTSYGSMYGLTWTHPNIGTGANQSIASLSHQLQLREAGLLKCAFGTGIWTAHSITSGNQGTLWGSSNDGSGSGLDADLLDGMDSQRFNRGDNNYGVMVGTSGWNMNDLFTTRNRAGFFDVWSGSNFPPSTSHVHGIQVRHNSSAHYGWQLAGQYAQNTLWHRQVSNNTWGSWNQQWGSGNDGSGSGLDADLFDGRDSTSYVFGTSGYGGTNQGFASLTNAKSGFFDVYNSGTPTATWYSLVNMAHYGSNHGHQIAGSFYSAGDIYNRNNNNTSLGAWAKIWNTANDGSGSGLDADTVDGVQAASFLRSDATDYQENTIYQRGYLVNETGYRDRGVFGSYDSTKTNHIWSMGVAYKNHASGANFGNLYGLAYKHTNNPTGGALASGHQMVWCQNGGPTSAMGSNIWTSGSVYAASFLYNSDRAFKTNIKPIKNALSTVLSLCGVSYTLKKSGKNTTGFIAQEVEKVLPDMVDGDEGEKGVNYGQMVALLTEAMREQQNLIVSLQKEIQELKDATK